MTSLAFLCHQSKRFWVAAVLGASAMGVVRCTAQEDGPPKAETRDAALFNGKNLDGWRTVSKFDFEKHGPVTVDQGQIVLGMGRPATGVSYTKEFPRINYEVSLEARRLEGDDFFCGLTFPVDQGYCTLIVGGWGGGVIGLSNVDNESAVDNETTNYLQFVRGQWYKIRLRVTSKKIEAWIDKEQVVDLKTENRKFSVWWEQEPVRPFGVATWNTKGALRNLRLKRLMPAGAGTPGPP